MPTPLPKSPRRCVFFFTVFLFLSLWLWFQHVNYVFAQTSQPEKTDTKQQNNAAVGGTVDIEIQNPLTGSSTKAISPSNFVGAVIKAVLGLIGSIALLIFVIAGLIWLTSRGNDEKINKARGAIVWATLGLLVVFSSYIVLNFLLNAFSKNTIQSAPPAEISGGSTSG